MRVIYICSPYRSTDAVILQRNIDYARELTRTVLMQGDCPVTVHLYMTQCLNEDIEQERNTGLAAGREILRKCDAVFVGTKYGLSQGMKAEIKQARECGIPILFDEVLEVAI